MAVKSALMLALLLPADQAITVPSSPPELKKLLPDSCITTSRTALEWPSNVEMHRPVPRSHSLTVASAEPLTAVRQCPSMSTDHACSAWPSIVRTHMPLRRSHSRMVLSPELDRTMLADAFMLTTASSCPSRSGRATGALVAMSHSFIGPSIDPSSTLLSVQYVEFMSGISGSVAVHSNASRFHSRGGPSTWVLTAKFPHAEMSVIRASLTASRRPRSS